MQPSVYASQPTYMPAAVSSPSVAQASFYPGTNMDPGRLSTGLPSQPLSAATPSALSKGTYSLRICLVLVKIKICLIVNFSKITIN